MSQYAPLIQLDNPELSIRQIESVLRSYHDSLRQDLHSGDRAYIHGVCSLTVKPIPRRTINLPHMKGQKSRVVGRLVASPSKKISHLLTIDEDA